jgi:arginine decarboxylase
MNHGVDNRHQSLQVEPTAMQLFAEAVRADQTLFSTNGSTQNVHVAMMGTGACSSSSPTTARSWR